VGSDEENTESHLDQDQSLVELEQAMGDRDRKISEDRSLDLDARQAVLDEERSATGNGSDAESRQFDARQSELDRDRQEVSEAREALDRAQAERDEQRQELERRRKGSEPG